MNQDTLYNSGNNLIAGLWTLHRQEGFPIDLSVIECQERGFHPDWAEAIATATLHDELPQLCKCVEVPGIAKESWFMWVGRFSDQYEAAREMIKIKQENRVKP